ncbi:MAG: iron-containing alcohol dehydrogenase [Synergistetes bacterium]|nr:iron-containing alcohol dehydrogenase [Synergistota bacterium]MDW8191673.1 iron-containing alcohol dehydrogenase [Synergistota bacterium]
MFVKPFVWQIPTKLYFGVGEAEKIVDRVNELGGKNVLIVTDTGVLRTNIVEKIKGKLDAAGFKTEVFSKVEPNPTVEIVDEGVKVAKGFGCDLLVAVGGGSSIDTAKAIGLLLTNEGEIGYFWKNPPKNKILPLIAIPTTAGTGSEITWVTVIKDTNKKVKMGIGNPKLAPSIAICDPLLTVSMPPSVTAATGLDALTHAIESYTNVITEPISESIALHAIYLIGKYLRAAYAKGDNLEARYNMLLGSTMAALAFANTKLGVVHAITAVMGGYFDVPHGVINAILLPYGMEFNLIGNVSKFAKIAEALGENTCGLTEIQAARKAVEAVKELCRDVGIPSSLKEVGIKEEALEDICREAMNNVGIPINPRTPTVEDLIRICKAAM